ncbi:MAG: phosphoenolpyruvate carboxykinase (ATP), partial [Thermomicrobiales bacterium]
MKESGIRSAHGADKFGFTGLKAVHWNLKTAALYEHSLKRNEAQIVAGGALCAETGHHTGRSPKDKHTVVDELTEKKVWWDNNKKVSKEHFNNLLQDFLAHAKDNELFAQDLFGGADKSYRIKVRVFTELAWHSLFIRTLLIRPEGDELAQFVPELTILDFPSFKPDPKRHGSREGSDTMVAIDFTRKIVLICGSSYAGEMKKSVFTTLNFYLPQQGVMPMHCSA